MFAVLQDGAFALTPHQPQQQAALAAAIADILWQVRGSCCTLSSAMLSSWQQCQSYSLEARMILAKPDEHTTIVCDWILLPQARLGPSAQLVLPSADYSMPMALRGLQYDAMARCMEAHSASSQGKLQVSECACICAFKD